MSIAIRTPRRPAYVADGANVMRGWVPLTLILGAMSFNLFLCFANTSLTSIGNIHIIACEAVIISIVFLVSFRSMDQGHLLLVGAVTLLALTFSSLRVMFGTEDAIDVKFARDLIIPIAFFLLGLRARSRRYADIVVRVAAAIVLGVALFEYFFVETYTQFFNVAKYYISRGTMEAKQAAQSAELFISGIRPAGAEGGRNLFPILGDHRASSLFLEPVSLGNFGIIVFMWALVRSKFGPKYQFTLMAAGLALIVLSDSRFGAYFCAIALILALLPIGYSTAAVGVVPLAALGLLLFVPIFLTGSYDPQHRYIDNGFVGRLVLSGQLLGDLDVLNWLGLKPPRMQAFDSGYAYVIGGVGIVGLAILWYALLSIPGPDRQFYAFRNLAAAYYGVILLISNSPFTIKTASLLWFLIGVLASGPIAARARNGPNFAARAAIRARMLGMARQRAAAPDHSS